MNKHTTSVSVPYIGNGTQIAIISFVTLLVIAVIINISINGIPNL